MAVLNDWQKISRVLAGKPWGDGTDGSSTVSSDPNTRATILGTATETTGTAGSSAFADGDLVILHQTQGTGAGQWEVNKVASGGGSTSLTFQVAHQYTYGTGAQIIKVPRYTTATVSAHSVTAWNGTAGGVEVICAKTSTTVSGALNGNSLGFRGGAGVTSGGGFRGESTTGGNGTRQAAANGTGGGGGDHNESGSWEGPGGGGGGYASSGSTGTLRAGVTGAAGVGGGTANSADLTTLNFGGAGGAGSPGISGYEGSSGAGGAGGGIIILITKSLVTDSNTISASGGNGANMISSFAGGGGGGAGGSVLVVCSTATLGTNKVVSVAGSGGSDGLGAGSGGAGSAGRIAVHHSGTITGTSTPTFEDVTDTSLVESGGGYSFFL